MRIASNKADLARDPLFQHEKGVIDISDDQLRESVEGAQLKLQRERGTDHDFRHGPAGWDITSATKAPVNFGRSTANSLYLTRLCRKLHWWLPVAPDTGSGSG